MRLLIVSHYFAEHRGGIEIVAGELAHRLSQRGMEIRWAAGDEGFANGDDRVRRFPLAIWNITERQLGFPYPITYPSALKRLRQLVKWCDVVHIHDSLYLSNYFAYLFARRFKKPVVVTQHIGEIPYRNPLLRGLLFSANHTIARQVLVGADQTVFISPRVQSYFQQFVRFRRPPVYRPNGVDTHTFQPPSRMATVSARPMLLFVGRFVAKKGLLLLREIAQRKPSWDFVFCGWGPIDPRTWQHPNVCVVGSISKAELVPYYQKADLLVLPSVGEGFPLVVQEAAACGTASLISSETAQGQPFIQEFAFVVEPNVDRIDERLTAIFADRESLSTRRASIASFARREWDWDRCVTNYQQILESARRGGSQAFDAVLRCQ